MTQAEQALRTQSMTFMKIDSMGKKTLTGNIALAPDEARELKELAKKGVTADRRVSELEEKVARAQKDAGIWKRRYEKLLDQVQPYLDAIELAPERVRAFLNAIMTRPKETKEHTQPARRRGQNIEL
ncbi:MAG: hypothetical protein LUH41_02825 [Clostridiales bacterium]|nr:hypothetical protein [Clostridiales bacterium]